MACDKALRNVVSAVLSSSLLPVELLLPAVDDALLDASLLLLVPSLACVVTPDCFSASRIAVSSLASGLLLSVLLVALVCEPLLVSQDADDTALSADSGCRPPDAPMLAMDMSLSLVRDGTAPQSP